MNDEHIKEFMNTPSEDEVIIVEEEGNYICEETPTLKESANKMNMEDSSIRSLSNKEKVSDAQLKDVARMARALRPEEIRTVLDNIPVNYIYDKIGQVLETNRKFNEAIMKATDIIRD